MHYCTGLSLLNISLDTLRPERFEAMTRRRGLQRVLDTIQQALDLGYDPVKVGLQSGTGMLSQPLSFV